MSASTRPSLSTSRRSQMGCRPPLIIRFLPLPLLGNAASDARAATTQGRWLVGVIIAARVDHNRAPLNVGHSEVRHYHGLRGLAASIDGQHGHVALMALAIRSEVFAGVGWVIMATRRHAGRWLAIRSRARATIRINVDMESTVARR